MKNWRILILALVIALGLSATSVSGFSEELNTEIPGIQLFYAHTNSIKAELSISNGKASCSGRISPISSNATTSITVRLQRYEGGSWKNVTKWTGTSSAGGSYSISHGTYRTRSEGKVYLNGSLVESTSVNSASRTY